MCIRDSAQGVALAAQKEGISAVICIPEGAPLSKIAATRSYGAEVVLCKGVYDDAYRRAVEIQEESGRTFVHPFNDEAVIAGQGTVCLLYTSGWPDACGFSVPHRPERTGAFPCDRTGLQHTGELPKQRGRRPLSPRRAGGLV